MNEARIQPDDLAGVRSRIERVCREILPVDLPADRPFYVVWCGEIPAFAETGCIFGLEAKNLDLIARPHLGGRWTGRGPAILLNDHLLRKAASEAAVVDTAAARLAAFEMIAGQVAVHELAHVAENGFVRPEAPLPASVLFQTEAVRQFIATPAPSVETAAVDRACHGPEWIRAGLHLFHRLSTTEHWLRWWACTPHAVCDTADYGLSDVSRYAAALGDEPARRAAESLSAILASAAPAAFTELHARDLAARHHDSHNLPDSQPRHMPAEAPSC
ncbi:MAG TPA: hypothetical protein VGI81_19835 [Tepidisphaeraceae bacterium]